MSLNHYSSLDLPETTLWWTQNPQQQPQQLQIMEPIPNPSWSLHHHKNLFNLNNNQEQEQELSNNINNEQATTTSQEEQEGEHDHQQQEQEEEKEPMFEKPLTPSDVGKLNRLVIPKQHAEKYFPLGAASATPAVTSSTVSDSGECKGLLLSFEDESGKCWRFRYSYWNSSQSYVLTKGWSRYVKDKRLDAGDIVSFERHRGDSQRLFIRWRRRSASASTMVAQVSRAGHGGGGDGNNGKSGGGVGWTSGFYRAQPSYPTPHHQQQLAYQHQQHEGLHAGKGSSTSQGLKQRTILGKCSSSSSSSSKVLRLFGVNMECQTQHEDDDSTQECSYNNVAMPSTIQGEDNNNNTNHQNLYHNVINHHQPPNSYSNSHMLHQQPYYY